MQYLLLGYHDEIRPTGGGEAREGAESGLDVLRAARSAGVLACHAKLANSAEARTARLSAGGVVFTDGPFAETKEQLGGFVMIDCRDEHEAREWAARFARAGCTAAVEVRPVVAVAEDARRAALAEAVVA